MTRWILALSLLALMPGLAAAAPAPAAAPIVPPAQWESYRVLSDRNMFVRDRLRPRTGRTYSMPTYSVVASEDDRLVLTGVINQGPDYVAFFEDTRTGKTITVQVDAPLGRGRVTAMAMDSVDYTYDGRTTRIAVGSSLSGAVALLSRPAAPLSTPAAGIPVGRVPTGAPSVPAAGMMGGPPAPAVGIMAGPPAPAIGIMAGPLAPETGPMDEPPVAAAAGAGTAPLTATSAPGAPPATAPAAPAAPTAPTATEPLTVAPPTTSPPTALPPTTTPPAAAVPSAGTKDGGAAAILERMRQRREQELNK